MITAINVWDFDGTLADSSHRYKTRVCEDGVTRIDLQHWIDNENLTYLDTPIIENVKRFQAELADPSIHVVIATARIWCEQSEAMAAKHGILPETLEARKGRNDTRGGAEIKIGVVQRLLALEKFANVNKIRIYEDNVSYMKAFCDELGAEGIYFPSVQGY